MILPVAKSAHQLSNEVARLYSSELAREAVVFKFGLDGAPRFHSQIKVFGPEVCRPTTDQLPTGAFRFIG